MVGVFLLEICAEGCDHSAGLHVIFCSALIVYFIFKSIINIYRNVSRVHILLNGLKIHVFNRFAAYQQIAKQTGFAQFLNNVGGGSPRDTVKAKTNSEKLEMQLDSWWNNIWRLFGAIRFDIGSGRLIAGNHTLPTSCAIIFENFQCTF